MHPFPSAVDAAVTAALAAIAGAGPGRVALLAAAMLALQFSIGAWNDTLDADASGPIRGAGLEVLVTGTVMRDHADRERLATTILDRWAPIG